MTLNSCSSEQAASWVAGITSIHLHSQLLNLILFIFETKSYPVAQANLEFTM